MSTRIRLQRHGRKGKPVYTIVIADQRAPRDGRFIEKLGQYNPNTQPATMSLDLTRALHWVQNGAVPSDTVRAILSYKGVLMHKHLLDGVKKGAFSEDEAEKRYQAWMAAKGQKIESHSDDLAKAKADAAQARLDAEIAVNKKREEEIAAKNAPVVEETEEVATEEAPAVEAAATEEAPAEDKKGDA
jgi:small subunit ribosomal protein S16